MKFYAIITLFNAHIGVVWFEDENTTKNHQFYRRKIDSLQIIVLSFISNLTVRDGLQTPRSL